MPESPSVAEPLAFLRHLFAAAVSAVQPAAGMSAQFPPPPPGRLIVVGAGKAAGAMAAATERHYNCDIEGLVIVPEGYGARCACIEVVEASHPVPDSRGVGAATRILRLVQGAGSNDLVLCLISGGASALMAAPAPGITLDDKRAITAALLRGGASIGETNCVRKHLSAIKGGRLALAAAPARVVSLIVSDVVGDDVSVIASGPTTVDHSTCHDALAILNKFKVPVSAAVRSGLADGRLETPKGNLGDVSTHIIARPADAFAAAAAIGHRHGLAVLDLGDRCEGEARGAAAIQGDLARAIRDGIGSMQPPCIILSGGEFVVTVKGEGRGGPNTEFALALAAQLDGCSAVWALAADTDGLDGSAGAAGAVIGPSTLQRGRDAGLDVALALSGNDSATFFEALGDLVKPGPTLTNVNDFRAILVLPA